MATLTGTITGRNRVTISEVHGTVSWAYATDRQRWPTRHHPRERVPIRSLSSSRWSCWSAPGDIGADAGAAAASSPRTLESAAKPGRSAHRAPGPSRTTPASLRSHRRCCRDAWCAGQTSRTFGPAPGPAAAPAETRSRESCASAAPRRSDPGRTSERADRVPPGAAEQIELGQRPAAIFLLSGHQRCGSFQRLPSGGDGAPAGTRTRTVSGPGT